MILACTNCHRSQDEIICYVGNPHRKFSITRGSLSASALLSRQAAYHTESGWYLRSPLLSSLDPDDFAPIHQYLKDGDYASIILDRGKHSMRLERELNNYQRSQEIVRCGTIYSTAQLLEIAALQDLARRKLKVLTQGAPA